MLPPEFKSRIKIIAGMIGGFMFMSAIKELLPEYSTVPWLILGFILILVAVSK